MSDSLWPHGLQHTRLPRPSLSCRVCSKSCPMSWWCQPPNSSSSEAFSSCPQSFPGNTPWSERSQTQEFTCCMNAFMSQAQKRQATDRESRQVADQGSQAERGVLGGDRHRWGVGLLSGGDENRWWWWLHNFGTILKTTQLYTLEGWPSQ